MIATFYSYKGGVGRSMALVNVGEHLARQGMPVILVDWDLEAPGLERYFPIRKEDIEERPGVIDLLLEYRQAMARPEPPSPYAGMETSSNTTDAADSEGHLGKRLGFSSPREHLLDLGPSVGLPVGRLRLLAAGRRDGEHFASYAAEVQGFDWAGFYRDWEGEAYLEWFRRELMAENAVILVDSRTGVTEIGGVCVYQLADAVVMFCAPNMNNLEGTVRMAEAFERPLVEKLRGGRPLGILPVPARIPKVEQIEEVNRFLDQFVKCLGRYYDKLGIDDPDAAARQFQIPQIPLYSFTERIAVRENAQRTSYRSDDLATVYGRLAETLAKMAPSGSPLAEVELITTHPAKKPGESRNEVRERFLLSEIDRLIGELRALLRRYRSRRAALWGLAVLTPLALATAWSISPVIASFGALIPALYFFAPALDVLHDRWRLIEELLDRLVAERASWQLRQGDFERRLAPDEVLTEKLSAALARLASRNLLKGA